MFQAGPMGLLASLGAVSKIVLLVLFVFSVISWAVILYKWRAFRSSDEEDQRFLSAYTRTRDKDDLVRRARRLGASPSAAVFVGVMDRIAPEGDEGSARNQSAVGSNLEQRGELAGVDRPYLDRIVALILQGQISKQEAYLPFLATTGNTTPFIGLFGTVIGIINAFQEIGKQGTANIAAVAPGVAEALVATAAGLFTAIPAVIAYNYYLTRIRRTAFRVESFSVEFLNSLDSRVKQVGVRA